MGSYSEVRASHRERLMRRNWELNDDFRDGLFHIEESPKWINQVVRLVVEIGHDLLERNPHGKIVTIGQSPAPSGRAAEIEAGYRHFNAEVVSLPFSYRIFDFAHTSADLNSENKTDDDAWREIESDPEGIFFFMPLKGRELTIEKYEDATAAYAKTLNLYNLLPRDIVDHHKQTGEKVTFVDISRQVRGAASLAYIMLDLAKKDGCEEELRAAIDFRVYLNKTLGVLIERPCGLKVPGFKPLPCSSKELSCMFSAYAIGSAPVQGRMVPQYAPENWAELPGAAEGKPEYLDHMEKTIHKHVVDFLGKEGLLRKQKPKANRLNIA